MATCRTALGVAAADGQHRARSAGVRDRLPRRSCRAPSSREHRRRPPCMSSSPTQAGMVRHKVFAATDRRQASGGWPRRRRASSSHRQEGRRVRRVRCRECRLHVPLAGGRQGSRPSQSCDPGREARLALQQRAARERPLDAQGRDQKVQAVPKDIAELRGRSGARDHQVFFGAYEPERKPIGFAERFMSVLPAAKNALPKGDFRDWPEIEAWAAGDRARAGPSPRGLNLQAMARGVAL